MVLSWEDIDWQEDEGYNVVLHEFAHKLDMLNGDADGLPPLHRDMSRARWSEVLGAAFDDLSQYDEADPDAWMDPYGAESPAEFFAVASEAFFDTPAALHATRPALYEQLRAFYRQDPRQRLSALTGS
ncbi:MAG: M90 family metallopeptidase [Gammaproteobacteria bacterium]|nr:M90 family metallopeptidase [Gammaproteobacteria bacterium]